MTIYIYIYTSLWCGVRMGGKNQRIRNVHSSFGPKYKFNNYLQGQNILYSLPWQVNWNRGPNYTHKYKIHYTVINTVIKWQTQITWQQSTPQVPYKQELLLSHEAMTISTSSGMLNCLFWPSKVFTVISIMMESFSCFELLTAGRSFSVFKKKKSILSVLCIMISLNMLLLVT